MRLQPTKSNVTTAEARRATARVCATMARRRRTAFRPFWLRQWRSSLTLYSATDRTAASSESFQSSSFASTRRNPVAPRAVIVDRAVDCQAQYHRTQERKESDRKQNPRRQRNGRSRLNSDGGQKREEQGYERSGGGDYGERLLLQLRLPLALLLQEGFEHLGIEGARAWLLNPQVTATADT